MDIDEKKMASDVKRYEPSVKGNQSANWLDKPVLMAFPRFTREYLIIALIILLAFISRFALVGLRVMSHDEVNHVVPSYNLYSGSGYAHDPVTHGPLQFHLVALSYFLLGDSDFSSRVPAALFSTAAIIFILFGFRRYLGRIGSLFGGFLFLISPFILFYGRYTRNEAFIELFAVMTFYAFFRYYEKRDDRSLYLLAAVTALQFVTKEVAYIYTAQFLLFCGLLFLVDLRDVDWKPKEGENFLPSLFKQLRRFPSFNLIIFLGALILPQLAAFPIKWIGWDPLDYSETGILRSGGVLLFFFALSFLIGIWWNRRVFIKSAAIFYFIFIIFYTTFFSNGQGFFTGIIGSLGYWLSQQEVQRGGQPIYYYALILLPVYEFAAIAGSIVAFVFAIMKKKFWQKPGLVLSAEEESPSERKCVDITGVVDGFNDEDVGPEELADLNDLITLDYDDEAQESFSEQKIQSLRGTKVPVVLFLLYWSITALGAYSLAGEKMPWLSVHIAIPIALSAAWGLGYFFETLSWNRIWSWNGLIGLIMMISGGASLISILNAITGTNPPFAGKTLEQLKTTNQFVIALILFAAAIFVLTRVWKDWEKKAIGNIILLFGMSVLIILQGRTAYTASFINYDYANELLVYAHAGPGPKIALKQIEEVAARTGEGKAIKVAYDNDALYPYWWYFRDYSGKYFFGEGNPTRELRNYDVIIVNTSKEGRMEPIVQNEYYKYEYIRLWWPNQDYFNLTWDRIWNALSDPEMRHALAQIWLNRDYSAYAKVTGKTTLTAETWDPCARMAVYMKKDLLRKMWLLGDSDLVLEKDTPAFEEDEKFTQLEPVVSFGSIGEGEGQFMNPKNLALSLDNERVYVLDTNHNRVQYFTKEGVYEGQFSGMESRGFNQPWGIDVGPDGSVYIADTWNHRMMKFTADGDYILEWYANDPAEPEKSFYGPRDVAVDSKGTVYVSDTGNKRIMVYDENGNFQRSFGVSGMGEGEFDEQVGISLLDDDRLAVADTWNQRVQVIYVGGDHGMLSMAGLFDVNAWYSQTLENKPYIAGFEDGRILITDPESYLVNEYQLDGTLIRSWNGGGGDIDHFSMPTGIKIGLDGGIWVIDSANGTVNKFVLPD